jgi:hypothetical protein
MYTSSKAGVRSRAPVTFSNAPLHVHRMLLKRAPTDRPTQARPGAATVCLQVWLCLAASTRSFRGTLKCPARVWQSARVALSCSTHKATLVRCVGRFSVCTNIREHNLHQMLMIIHYIHQWHKLHWHQHRILFLAPLGWFTCSNSRHHLHNQQTNNELLEDSQISFLPSGSSLSAHCFSISFSYCSGSCLFDF